MTAIERLYVLLCGYEILPRSVSIRGGGDRFVMSVPISAYLLKTADGFVVFDTGFDQSLLNDPALCDEHFTRHGWETPVVWPCHEMLGQLAAVGVAPEDIRHVILSHAHLDHTGHLKHFCNAKVWIQEAERDFAFRRPASAGVIPRDLDVPGLDWCWVEGDHEIMPGLDLIFTPGHTPGHQSALVRLPQSGPALLVGDVGDRLLNFDEEILPGEASNDEEALSSIRRINKIRYERSAQMFVCHDPRLIQIQKLAPDFYD